MTNKVFWSEQFPFRRHFCTEQKQRCTELEGVSDVTNCAAGRQLTVVGTVRHALGAHRHRVPLGESADLQGTHHLANLQGAHSPLRQLPQKGSRSLPRARQSEERRLSADPGRKEWRRAGLPKFAHTGKEWCWAQSRGDRLCALWGLGRCVAASWLLCRTQGLPDGQLSDLARSDSTRRTCEGAGSPHSAVFFFKDLGDQRP